jgi:serine/threonine protein kinase
MQIDVTALEPFTKIDCPQCRSGVRVRRQFDHFVILRQIGEGGMSRVFEAEDTTLGRRVALKILNRTYSRDAARMSQFQNEATITASVTHPNVIKLYTVGFDQGYFYIAMELVSGGTLEGMIKKLGRVPEKQALRIGRQVADGLRAAYKVGLLHRDVKPQNILFTEDGTAKVVDFGLALFANTKDESGEIWATPFYVSPEKVIENKEDFRSDLFSLGASLFHALTGKPPHKADTNSLSELRMIKCKRVTLEDSGLTFAPRTFHAVDKLLAFKPEERHASYEEAVEELRLAEGLTEQSGRLPWSRRRKIVAYMAAAALFVAFCIGWIIQSLSSPSTSVTTDVLVPDELNGGGVTLTSGTMSTGERFMEARRTLLAGRLAEAEKQFEAIVEDSTTVQPTMNKARFNAALCAIMAARQHRAQKLITDIGRDAAAGDDPAATSFYKKLAAHMGDHLGLKSKIADLKDYATTTEEVLGYLAHGLAQWHLGNPLEGRAALETFFSSNSPDPTLAWINQYRDLIAPYRHDISLASTLRQPEDKLDAEAANKLIAETEEIKAKLKTQGTLQRELDRRLNKLRGSLNKERLAQQREQMREQLERYKRESEQLTEILAALPGLARGYDVSLAVEALADLQFDTPAAKRSLETQRYLYTGQQAFLEQLFTDIKLRGWQGRITSRSGVPIDGRIVSADLRQASITLPYGSRSVELSQVAPQTLLQIAQDMLTSITDSTEYYRRAELCAVFAHQQGLRDEPYRSQAQQLMREHRGFASRWLQVLQGG